MAFNFQTKEFNDDKPKQLKEYGKLKLDYTGTVEAKVYIDGTVATTLTFTSVGVRKQEEKDVYLNGRRFYIVLKDSSSAVGYVYDWELDRIPLICGADQLSDTFDFKTEWNNDGNPDGLKEYTKAIVITNGDLTCEVYFDKETAPSVTLALSSTSKKRVEIPLDIAGREVRYRFFSTSTNSGGVYSVRHEKVDLVCGSDHSVTAFDFRTGWDNDGAPDGLKEYTKVIITFKGTISCEAYFDRKGTPSSTWSLSSTNKKREEKILDISGREIRYHFYSSSSGAIYSIRHEKIDLVCGSDQTTTAFNFQTKEFNDDKPKQLKEYGKLKLDYTGTISAKVYIDGTLATTLTFTNTGLRKPEEQDVFLNGRRFYILLDSTVTGAVYSLELDRVPILCGSDQLSDTFDFKTEWDSDGDITQLKEYTKIVARVNGDTNIEVFLDRQTTPIYSGSLTTSPFGINDGIVELYLNIPGREIRVRFYNASGSATIYSLRHEKIDLVAGISHFMTRSLASSTPANNLKTPSKKKIFREMFVDFKSFSLVGSFPISTYDASAADPRGLAYASDDTLWVADHTTVKVYNITTAGALISSFPATTIDATLTMIHGIATASDGTLWVSYYAGGYRIANITTTGTMITSFSVAVYPSSLAEDTDGSLWLSSYGGYDIYHYSATGTLLATIPINAVTYGMAIDPNGTLWVTTLANYSHMDLRTKILNITKSGVHLSSFNTISYDPLATNANGIAIAAAGDFYIADAASDKIYHVKFKDTPLIVELYLDDVFKFKRTVGQVQRGAMKFRLPPSCRGYNYYMKFSSTSTASPATNSISIYGYGISKYAVIPS